MKGELSSPFFIYTKPSEHELTPCYHIMVRMQDIGSEINYSNGPVGRVFYFEKIDIFKKYLRVYLILIIGQKLKI